MPLKILIGAMKSSKTSEGVKLASIKALSSKVLYINYRFEDGNTSNNRETEGGDGITFTSHNPSITKLHQDVDVCDLNLLDEINPNYLGYDTYIIDDAQFFDDLEEGVKSLLYQGKDIIVAGLVSNFKAEKFGHIHDILYLCDNGIEMLYSKCELCDYLHDASFTMRTTNEDEEIVVGADNYIPVCRNHHPFLTTKK